MLVGLVGDEVASPAVGEFMGDHLSAGGVPLDDSGCQEDHHRILHATVGETRGKHEEVEAPPLVWPEERLPSSDHVLGAGELPGSGIEKRRITLGMDASAGPDVAGGDAPGRKGEEVGRDGAIHHELLHGAAGSAPEAVGAGGASLSGDRIAGISGACRRHDGGEGTGEIEASGEGDTCGRGVLARENGAGMDGLALGVDERVSLGSGLGGGEPLKRGGGRGSRENE